MKLKKIEVTQTVHALVQRFGSVIQANDGSDSGKVQVELTLNSDINSVVIATPKETLLIPREWCVLWPAEHDPAEEAAKAYGDALVYGTGVIRNTPMGSEHVPAGSQKWFEATKQGFEYELRYDGRPVVRSSTLEPEPVLCGEAARAFAQTVSDIPAAKVCQWCGASFVTGASLGGHKRHCDKRPTG